MVDKHDRSTNGLTALQQIIVKAWVTGRVQGVGFRYWTQKQARKLGLMGYAHNLIDGRVEICLYGDEGDVQLLLAALKKGSPLARVDDLYWQTAEHEPSYYDFSIG